ncbi:rhomboid family intramembrane serine protease [Phenylobacterium sp.]|jgi:membrane associated rhomboid family serine protease|uniref:rhomboid family intramembrane serine protease n=1 Tax=Phenylobacterium sp. TaxID=1871053 RepID=UPI002F3E6623
MPPEPDSPPARQPILNAPWPAAMLAAVIVAGFAVQSLFPPEAAIAPYAFRASDLEAGRWITLLTALFLHGSWPHALMNAAFALAFGTPVARFLGLQARGVLVFVVFYLACGVLGNLAFAALHRGDPTPLVGASGAVSGLMGAAARLIAGRGRPGPILSRPVIGMGAAWVLVNLLVAVTGIAPGANGASVAWEAHLGGFAAGVLSFGAAAWAARGPQPAMH